VGYYDAFGLLLLDLLGGLGVGLVGLLTVQPLLLPPVTLVLEVLQFSFIQLDVFQQLLNLFPLVFLQQSDFLHLDRVDVVDLKFGKVSFFINLHNRNV